MSLTPLHGVRLFLDCPQFRSDPLLGIASSEGSLQSAYA